MSDENQENKKHRRYRPGIFWPLVLIVIGVVFLLSSMGIIQGNAWDNIFQLWPILLILISLDGYFNRKDFTANTLLLVAGILFLLSNLGYLTISIWNIILYLWPLLIIAFGIDLITRRGRWWVKLAGLAIFIVILFGVLWYVDFGLTNRQVLATTDISQPLESATSAEVSIEPFASQLKITDQAQPGMLISGLIPENDQIYQDFSLNQGNAIYRIWQTGPEIMFLPMAQAQESWTLGLTREIPIALQVKIVIGNVNEDLTGLTLNRLDVESVISSVQISLPQHGQFTGKISGVMGNTVIQVPEAMEVRIVNSSALSTISVPDDFEQSGDVYTSPGYEDSENQAELTVSSVMGRLEITQ